MFVKECSKGKGSGGDGITEVEARSLLDGAVGSLVASAVGCCSRLPQAQRCQVTFSRARHHRLRETLFPIENFNSREK